MSHLGAEDQIVIYHFLDGTGGVDPEAAAPGIFSELKKTWDFSRVFSVWVLGVIFLE